MTGCRRLETQKEKHFSRIKALPRCPLFSKTDWGFYSSRRSWSSSDCLDSPFALFSPHVLVLPLLPGDPAKGEWRGGYRSSAPRSPSPSPRPALFATVSDRRRRVWQRGARAHRLPASGRGLASRPSRGTHAELPGRTGNSHLLGEGNFCPGGEIKK